MKIHTQQRQTCYKCYRPQSSCMCSYIQSFDTNTKFIILMHPKEFKKVKNNTGRFTHLSLQNSELFIGIDFSHHSKINKIIDTHESYILFPSTHAVNLSEENPQLKSNTKKNLAIFLIDSTWGCTQKIFKQSINLQKLKHMSFSTTRTSEYKIKVQPRLNYLSTIESTHVVLELLNKHKIESIQSNLLGHFLEPFYEMVRYQETLIKSPRSCEVRFKNNNLIT